MRGKPQRSYGKGLNPNNQFTMLDTTVSIAGLSLKNPLLPGSGPPGANLRKLQTLERAGIGAMLAKTISSERAVVPKPCMAFDGELFFNIEKWSEYSVSVWASEILPSLKQRSVPLLLSIGYTPADLEAVIPAVDEWADGYELSTHYRTSTNEQYAALVGTARRLTSKPIIMKLSAHAPDLVTTARTCEDSGANCITAINSIGPVVSIDIEKRASRLGVEEPYAWLSGPAIKPIALRAVYDIARAVRIPVIGCGGVTYGRDVIEFMMAGATAVECCTALIRGGPKWIQQTLTEISAWCSDHDVVDLKSIIGSAVPHYISSHEKK
jgi:dihydroorotate dehydrogenase subfamily 1